jgi:hypothetical protein
MQAEQNIIYKELGEEAALLNIQNGEFYTLNETGKFIWQAVTSKDFDLNSAAEKLSAEYEIDKTEATAAISSFLKDLRSQKLLK